ncbi:MAG: hypothetical protein Q9212_000375 [Teloschistes hypoglaucus]
MLAAIDRQRPAESETETNGDERTPQQCNASSYQDYLGVTEHTEPVQFATRLVLGQRVPIRTRDFVQMHKSYRLAQQHVNKILTDHVEFEKKEMAICGTGLSILSDDEYVLLRCALRERYDMQLRVNLQLKQLVHPDIQELALFEQFWKKQGKPNASERILLRNASFESQRYIDTWFAAKEHGHRAIHALGRKMVSGLNDKTAYNSAGRIPKPNGPDPKNHLP